MACIPNCLYCEPKQRTDLHNPCRNTCRRDQSTSTWAIASYADVAAKQETLRCVRAKAGRIVKEREKGGGLLCCFIYHPVYSRFITTKNTTSFATMGMSLGKVLSKLFGNKEMRVLMLGLDAAGKTSIHIIQNAFVYMCGA